MWWRANCSATNSFRECDELLIAGLWLILFPVEMGFRLIWSIGKICRVICAWAGPPSRFSLEIVVRAVNRQSRSHPKDSQSIQPIIAFSQRSELTNSPIRSLPIREIALWDMPIPQTTLPMVPIPQTSLKPVSTGNNISHEPAMGDSPHSRKMFVAAQLARHRIRITF